MAKQGPANSIISDPAPFQPPSAAPKPKRPTASDWAKLGRSRKYKQVDAQFEAKKEYWRHFTPGGTKFAELYINDPEAATRHAVIASEVIGELDDMQYRIQREAQS